VFSTFVNGLRVALRLLVKRPGATTVALATLALTVGANTAVFSVVNGVLPRPLPFPEADRLVQVLRTFPSQSSAVLSVPKFALWRERADLFAHAAAYDNLGSGFNLTGGLRERVVGSRVTRDFFTTLGVQPALGRGFLDEEDRPRGRKVVVLSHGRGASAAIGRSSTAW
jgi:hypothetical protein